MSFGVPVVATVRNLQVNLSEATSLTFAGQSNYTVVHNRTNTPLPVHFDSSPAYTIAGNGTLTLPNAIVRTLTFGEAPDPARYSIPSTQVDPGGLVASGKSNTAANLTTVCVVSVIAAVTAD